MPNCHCRFSRSSTSAPPRRLAASAHFRRSPGHGWVRNSIADPFWPFAGVATASLAGDTPGKLAAATLCCRTNCAEFARRGPLWCVHLEMSGPDLLPVRAHESKRTAWVQTWTVRSRIDGPRLLVPRPCACVQIVLGRPM